MSLPKYSQKPIIVVSGVGNGSGTGNATAREFGAKGYRVALISRREAMLQKAADEINSWPDGDAAVFPVAAYNKSEIQAAFVRIKSKWPGAEIRVALFNTGHRVEKLFFDLTEEDILLSSQTNVLAGFAFAQEAITAFREYEVNDLGYRGTLIFTSATAALRGNEKFAAFAAAKHGVRALSQSLNKEFGKQNIHVAHAVIDGTIVTDITTKTWGNPEWAKNEDVRVSPPSIAKAYWYIAHQDRSAWTWELDLRPAHEKW